VTATILLIDDQDKYVTPLAHALQERLSDTGQVVVWVPNNSDRPLENFDALLKAHDVRLVVTDYDLTQGQLGFFGSSVVDWCQKKAIPVGDFSRGHASSLAEEPNMFELRVPIDSDAATVNYICTVFLGFKSIRNAIDSTPELSKQRSPAAVAAAILGVQRLESQFAQYGIRYGGANSALFDSVASTASTAVVPEREHVARLLTYITGHLLVNAILRFPGPLMDEQALCAYLAVEPAELPKFRQRFEDATYRGPFAAMKPFLWTHAVDDILAGGDDGVDDDDDFTSTGAHNRQRLEILLGDKLARHNQCEERCHGEEGGFLCPFTKRPVCQRADCSVVSNAWIPAGARLARFEKGFYDEWSPILGM
jgi:hypothetical protein